MPSLLFRLAPLVSLAAHPDRFSWRPCRSWTHNYVQHSYDMFINAGLPDRLGMQDIAGLSWPVAPTDNPYLCLAAAADDSLGVLLGTGTQAVSWSTFALDSPIPQGTAPGQVGYGASAVAGGGATPDQEFVVQRIITSPDAPSTDVLEMALYATDGVHTFCLIYDTFAQPIILSDSLLYVAQYLIRTA